ncbi:pumilio-repeat, RNA-binding protein [Trypanosoma grayi]|uniref:pumilio-repeat, RNA-binding protein n=1 Tax=Trypanosoma grayi TaxID=71804 RepID=UPI0004F4AE30|nr:pumilio-repeat, RNA-binding protein [Trypanosoma grayi]KEG13691.1 pumilio-repeat, RNA-binding protein [Trypanosoma grayi]
MGKKATFERAHQRQVRHTREQRQRKSAAVKAMRRGEDDSGRLIQYTTTCRSLVTDEKKAMLVEQFAQACRLPAACEDLCMLLRQVAGEYKQAEATRKRLRDDNAVSKATFESIIDAFLQLEHQAATTTDEDDEEEPLTLLEEVIQDECGSRVVCALIAAVDASASDEKKALVLDALIKLFEENETLYEHYVACKVMSALVLHGDHAIQERVLQVLKYHSGTVEQLQLQLRNRHSAVTIHHLIEQLPIESIAWLSDTLCATDCIGGKKKNKTKMVCDDEDNLQETLISLILDPVASPVMRALFLRSANRAAFLRKIEITTLLTTKRGCKFLQETLSPELPNWAPEEAMATLDVVMAACEANLVEMCTSSDANFVVQAVIGLIPLTGDPTAVAVRFKGILNVIGPHFSTLSTHYIGVHVVVALVGATLSLSTKALAEEIASMLVTRNNVADIVRDPHGSLIVRKLLPLCAVKDSKVGQLLASTIEKDMTSLMYDAIGNLTVQEYIKVRGAENLARSLMKSGEELASMCQHAYASHVVGCIFDNVGASTHSSLCNALRPHVVVLSRHVNGRFVVEKALGANRDICDLLLRHFTALACEKGTQHVLCALVSNLDQRGKQKVVDLIISGLTELSTQQCSSIVLQKLMQADEVVLQAVQKELTQKPRLRNNLAQNFFGKFVVQITDAVGN